MPEWQHAKSTRKKTRRKTEKDPGGRLRKTLGETLRRCCCASVSSGGAFRAPLCVYNVQAVAHSDVPHVGA
jgi:hypothetical protein